MQLQIKVPDIPFALALDTETQWLSVSEQLTLALKENPKLYCVKNPPVLVVGPMAKMQSFMHNSPGFELFVISP